MAYLLPHEQARPLRPHLVPLRERRNLAEAVLKAAAPRAEATRMQARSVAAGHRSRSPTLHTHSKPTAKLNMERPGLSLELGSAGARCDGRGRRVFAGSGAVRMRGSVASAIGDAKRVNLVAAAGGARNHRCALKKYNTGAIQRSTPNAPLERAWLVPSMEGRLAARAFPPLEPAAGAVWLGPAPAAPPRAERRSSIVDL